MPKTKSKIKKKKQVLTRRNLSTINPLVFVSALSVLLLVILANVQTTQYLSANSQRSVLGDDDDSGKEQSEDKSGKSSEEEKEKEEDKHEEEVKKEATKKQNEITKSKHEVRNTKSIKSISVTPKVTKTIISPTVEIEIENEIENENENEDNEVENEKETEIETNEGLKIKTKIKDGVTTKLEIERGELKLKYEYKNGQLELKAEDENGEEVELEESELSELEDQAESEMEDEGLELKHLNEDTTVITKNQVSAITEFPLSVDVGTNSLILTTTEGQRVVTVLPDQAVQSLLSNSILNKIDTATDTEVKDQVGSSNGVVEIELQNNDIVYKIKGTKEYKLFGFIPVNSPTTAFVSANDGAIISQQRAMLVDLIDLLSPGK